MQFPPPLPPASHTPPTALHGPLNAFLAPHHAPGQCQRASARPSFVSFVLRSVLLAPRRARRETSIEAKQTERRRAASGTGQRNELNRDASSSRRGPIGSCKTSRVARRLSLRALSLAAPKRLRRRSSSAWAGEATRRSREPTPTPWWSRRWRPTGWGGCTPREAVPRRPGRWRRLSLSSARGVGLGGEGKRGDDAHSSPPRFLKTYTLHKNFYFITSL